MRPIALTTALLMALPVAAYADPPQVDHDRDHDRDRAVEHERYDHWNDSHWSHDFHGHWRSFGRTFNARTDRQFVNLGGGRYHMLRLEAVRGEPEIDRVTILFNDGASQTVNLDARLMDGAGEVINLDPDRRVRRVIVFTQPNTRGLYSVYAG
ncbi:MAG TPA: hypothetical protein VHW23_17625 [Kofleriaceae bacterium]|jgi:hypothetical protein|nr:hypothetical protein [Kofleriaceae bacterium]